MHKKQFDNTILLYFRGTILVDLDVPLSFPVFHLPSFWSEWNAFEFHIYFTSFLHFVAYLSKCTDLDCSLSRQELLDTCCKLSMTQALTFVCDLSSTDWNGESKIKSVKYYVNFILDLCRSKKVPSPAQIKQSESKLNKMHTNLQNVKNELPP